MNNRFDELAKGLAQSVTRRQALKKFGIGLAGMALACFGIVERSKAVEQPCTCTTSADCQNGYYCAVYGYCAPKWCDPSVNGYCCCYCKGQGKHAQSGTAVPTCNPNYLYCSGICGAFC